MHPLSLTLALQANIFSQNLPSEVLSCEIVDVGIVELQIRAGSQQGYGRRAWPFRIGGPGLGDDPAFAAAFGGTPRAPVAARFAVPISMHGVDDMGFVGNSFWQGLQDGTTLQLIAERAAEWLCGEHLSGDAKLKWQEVETHESQKLGVIEIYQQQAKCASLLDPCARLEKEWLMPPFQEAVSGIDWRGVVEEVSEGIFAFDFFTPQFCDMLIAELDSYEATSLPKRRPNTMNRYGLIVNEIGMEPLMTHLVQSIMAPMLRALFPDELIVQHIDHHHSFVVEYKHDGGDHGLDMHHDASEATLNVCLGRDSFVDGGLRFCGHMGNPDHRRLQHVHKHKKGQAVLHLGRQRHGADDISAGERLNLIVWARSSAFRAAAAFGHIDLDGYPKKAELGVPDQICLSKSNDDDYHLELERHAKGAAAAAASNRGGGGEEGSAGGGGQSFVF
jgi:hypothetical protein